MVLLVAGIAAGAEAGARARRSYYDDYDYYPRRRPAYPRPDDRDEDEDDTIYRFMVAEDDYGAYVYHDEEGYAQGFEIDLLLEVCRRADKKCYFTMDKAEHCWYNEGGHEYPGVGLLAGWYAGCMGFFPTVERKNSFDFTRSFTKTPEVTVWYNKDALNQTNYSIGFVKGWAATPACLDRQSDQEWFGRLGQYTQVYFETMKDMLAGLRSGEVDGILGPQILSRVLEEEGFSHVDPHFQCTTGGAAVMFRYGSDASWWNKVLDDMVEDGDFRDFCRRSARTHADHGELFCDLD